MEPSRTLIPFFLFLILFFKKYNFLKLLKENFNLRFFLIFIFLTIFFGVFSNSDNILYVISNSCLTFLIYLSSFIFFNTTKYKNNLFTFSIAFIILGLSFLDIFNISSKEIVRNAGFAENPNSAAFRLTFLYIVVTYLLKNKYLVSLFTIACFSLIFSTLSRSGLILFLISCIIILPQKFSQFSSLREYIKKSYKSLILVFFFFILFLNFIPLIVQLFGIDSPSALSRIKQLSGQEELINESDSTSSGRVTIALNYLELFFDKPFGYGTGMNTFRDLIKDSSHNMYLRIAIDFGIIGLIFYLYFIYKGIVKSIEINNLYRLSIFIVFIIGSFFTNTFFEDRTFIICLAFLDSNIYLIKKNTQI